MERAAGHLAAGPWRMFALRRATAILCHGPAVHATRSIFRREMGARMTLLSSLGEFLGRLSPL